MFPETLDRVRQELAQLQDRVRERYPGIVLESVVQGWVYLDEFQKGIDAYHALDYPMAQDDRWLGVCYLMQRDRFAAQEALYRAIIRGEVAARIELARVLSFYERNDEANHELAQVDLDKVKPPDRVLWYRAQSIQKESTHSLKEAIDFAEEAWRLVQGLPEFPILAPWVLIRLGRLHSQVGRGQRALWFLDRAHQLIGDQPYLLLNRAECLITVGRYSDAIEVLEAIPDSTSDPKIHALKLWLLGEIHWATDNIAKAFPTFDQAAEIALYEEENSIEVFARLGFACLALHREWFEAAFEHLLRAKMIANTLHERLLCDFRETILNFRRGELTIEEARAIYEQLKHDFGEMGLLQELAWVRLHLAELHRLEGSDGYLKEFEALQGLGVALQNRTFLAREWILLPDLKALALKTHPKMAGKTPAVLEVYTLGEERLVLNGKPVIIRLRKGVELVSYFLEHRQVSLKKVLLDIFPDDKPRSARSYFHQFRNELHARVPGLRIEYDAESRSYRLETELDVLWDVAELRAGRKLGGQGIFLPSSGSEWAAILDEELEPLRNQPFRLLAS
jgi:tetratricopeptide (TPR) repeat protein